MSIPMTEISIKKVVEYTIKLIQSDPEAHLRDIFGDLRLEPNQALYGDRVIEQIKGWIATTKINVMTGYDLSQTELPCVSVNMGGSTPSQKFMGDHGGHQFHQLSPQDREVIVPAFSPVSVTVSSDRTYATFQPPADLPPRQAQLVIPGFHLRDARGVEYVIGFDDSLNLPTIVPFSQDPEGSIDAGQFGQLTVISPLRDAKFRDGVMLYDEVVTVDVHGHQNRNENRWLWAIVVWGLHRFRPILESTFNMTLSAPSSSDIEIDPSFQGVNVWVRRITLSSKAVTSWRGVRLQDVIGLIECINETRASN